MSDWLIERVRKEVCEVHAFIQAWIRGELDNDDDVWNDGFARRFAAGFAMVTPQGEEVGPGRALPGVRAMHGTNPRFRIVTRHAQVVAESGDLVVATYHELQRFARHQDEPENGRVATVAFENRGDQLLCFFLLTGRENQNTLPVLEIGIRGR